MSTSQRFFHGITVAATSGINPDVPNDSLVHPAGGVFVEFLHVVL